MYKRYKKFDDILKLDNPKLKVDTEFLLELFHNQAESDNSHWGGGRNYGVWDTAKGKYVYTEQPKSMYDDTGQDDFISWIVEYLENVTNDISYYTDDYGNAYITKGDGILDKRGDKIFPCMVAHVDQVHDISDNYHVTIIEDLVVAFDIFDDKVKQVGTGGDDKVGIFVAMELFKKYDSFKIALFKDEEIGTVGSKQADMDFFDDVSFVLQCDRRGHTDFITSIGGVKLNSKSFRKKIRNTLTNHGYSFTDGGLTDVQALKLNGLKVCCANMSCAYYNPHYDDEVVHLVALETVLNMCNDIVELCQHKKWQHEYTRKRTYNNWTGHYPSASAGSTTQVERSNLLDEMGIDLQNMSKDELSEFVGSLDDEAFGYLLKNADEDELKILKDWGESFEEETGIKVNIEQVDYKDDDCIHTRVIVGTTSVSNRNQAKTIIGCNCDPIYMHQMECGNIVCNKCHSTLIAQKNIYKDTYVYFSGDQKIKFTTPQFNRRKLEKVLCHRLGIWIYKPFAKKVNPGYPDTVLVNQWSWDFKEEYMETSVDLVHAVSAILTATKVADKLPF